MKIYKNANLNKKHHKGVIAIGNFDGIHLGHQKVVNEARKKAKSKKLPFGIITFEPMPVMYFNSKIKNHRINSLEQKKIQLKKLKLDFLIIIKFNKIFSSLTAEKFIKEIIYNKTKCSFLYVSKNFKFGYKRRGNIQTLKKYEKLYNFKSLITRPYKKNKKIISSTLIREKIINGKIREANTLLNREWNIKGKVIKGRQLGRKIGFPTCNLQLNDYIVPRNGVYAVKVKGSNFNKKGIANVGFRPTFNGKKLLL